MPYNLTFSGSPQFSPTTNNQPNVQDWAFSPISPIQVNHVIGEALPSDIDITCAIKDYVTESAFIGEDIVFDTNYEFYVKHSVTQINPQQNVPQMISLSGNINDATGDGFLLSQSNLQQVVTVSFQNLQIVPEGNYGNIIAFRVFKKNLTTSQIVLHDVRFFQINITVANGDPFMIVPDRLTFVYVGGSGTDAPQSLEITATGAFTIYVKSYITLSGGNLVDAGIVDYWLPGPGTTRKYTGTNSQTVAIDANNLLEDFDQGYYNSQLKYDNGILFQDVDIQTIVFDSDETTITPSNLEFSAVRGFSEALPQTISIASPYSFTITAPSWLTISQNSETYFLDLNVVPLLSENLSEGVYEGNIIVTANGVDYLVPVIHTVVDTVDLGMSEDGINFTDDFNTITRIYNELANELSIVLGISTYDYNSDVERYKELRYKIPVFNNKGEFFVGRTVKKLMAELMELSTINFENFQNIFPLDPVLFFRPYYKPSNVNLEITFINTATQEAIGSLNYNNLGFLKGRKPLKSFPYTAILNYHAEPLRVTPRSVALLNFYKTQTHFIRIYKNGNYHTGVPHNFTNHNVWMFKYAFRDYVPGDVVEIRVYKNNNGGVPEGYYDDASNFVSQTYIVCPEGKRSYHIAWEDEYGVLDMMEFTGDISFKMGYENNIIKDYKSFKESLRKTDSRRSQNVIINTGFLLQENPKRLDSLLASKRAWIMDKGNDAIALVPDTSVLNNYDSDQELYAYDVEFQINLNNDYKINS